MKSETKRSLKRAFSALLCLALLVSYIPSGSLRTRAATGQALITTVADPATLTRPEIIYGDSTLNAGKITVGKSVSDEGITVGGQTITLDGDNNFLVTISQSAQVMGLSTESAVPVDVVFVLDTSGSMASNDRSSAMVTAANTAIAALMESNENNRVAVVAFSSEGYGGGSSNNAAANVLSSLAHYDGEAATEHLRWVTSSGSTTSSDGFGGSSKNYIAGRDMIAGSYNSSAPARRNGENGGTNIQAGIAAGADLLLSAKDTTITDAAGKEISRMPFLVILSDGQPTFVYDDPTWYDPGAGDEIGPGSGAYEGNGFMTALTAAYYKGLISEHYYGTNVSANNRCYVYTIGVEMNSLSGAEKLLAQITLDPATYSSGTYNEDNAVSYWNYGNTANGNTTRDSSYGWKTYWNNYLSGKSFGVRVDRGEGVIWVGNGPEGTGEPKREDYSSDRRYREAYNAWYEENYRETMVDELYTLTETSIAASRKYVTSVAYNDDYFDAGDVSQMESVFDQMLSTIQQKAMSAPTQVSTGDHDFDGYVTFTDPLGEYMEVKDMKGIVVNGQYFTGAEFARKLSNFGTANADTSFDQLMLKVVDNRLSISNTNMEEQTFIKDSLKADNQAYYNGPNDYDNSIVWWGRTYSVGENEQQVQTLGIAGDDSIAFLSDPNNGRPQDANVICRSYFFQGEGGGNANQGESFLYLVVRVQRELTAPYRQTVVISAPASLLSMEKVLIHQRSDGDSTELTANVSHDAPVRVIYEVGLWDSITPETVAAIVSDEYKNETLVGTGSVNYDAATQSYSFFTNDWDRSQTAESHHRPMAKATFEAAADNPFYTYQEDTLLVDANKKAITQDPHGKTAYVIREYYTWTDGGVDGTYAATKSQALIQVDVPANAQLKNVNGQWYIPKGAYTSATLVVNGDDTEKTENATGTSAVVNHPHRTGEATDPHYTVYLGNNGKLTMVSDPYEPEKFTSVNLDAAATTITDDNGKAVRVGDTITYTVEAANILAVPADLTITDYVPAGTAFVPGSAGFGTTPTGHTKDASLTPDNNNMLTWVLEDVPAGEIRYVSFTVTVTEAALNLTAVPGSISNTAWVQIGNGASVATKPVGNGVYGKDVTDSNNQSTNGSHGGKVGDVLVYTIRWTNESDDVATVTITDIVPQGTTFLSADQSAVLSNGVLTWQFTDVQPGATGAVSFRVQIDGSVKANATGTQPATGELTVQNYADILVNNDPLVTNTTKTYVDTGSVTVSKIVASGDTNRQFAVSLTDPEGKLEGTYPLSNGATITFAGGKGLLSLGHRETVTVNGLPVGVILTVEEDMANLPGWTATYSSTTVTATKGGGEASSATITNNYRLQALTLTLQGEKVLQGDPLPNPVTFGFVAQPSANNPVVGDPLSGEVTVQSTGAYRFRMSPKTFTQPGTYTYTIYELNGGKVGVTYDDTVYTLVITVADRGDGTMGATVTLNGQAFNMDTPVRFTNTYAPLETALELGADKALTGRDLASGEFTFLLTDGTDTYRGINDAQGNILFEEMVFDEPGTYTYTMSEEIPANGAKGITYDRDTHTVVVTVTDQNGQLATALTVDGRSIPVVDGVADTGVLFENTFTPDDVALVLESSKILWNWNGTSYERATPEAGKFRFQVADASGNVVSTGTNDAQGNIVFSPIYISAEMMNGQNSKTFTYNVSEVVPQLAKDPNMLYDSTQRTLTATVTKGNDGTLTVTVEGDSDGTVTVANPFQNYQNPAYVAVMPKGQKTTNGSNLPGGLSFSFKVVSVEDGKDAGVGTSAATVGGSNSESGAISFTNLVYTHESLGGAASKTFRYWIMEANAGAGNNGVTYDTTRYLYQVTLSRDAYGRLVAEEAYFALANGGNAENAASYTVPVTTATFTNTYASATHLNLVAGKVLTGRNHPLADGEYDFLLQRLDTTGKIVSGSFISGTNDANGRVSFATLNYSNAMLTDAYKHTDGAWYFSYLMTEIKPDANAIPGVTYDQTAYVVTVKVTQTANGMTATLAGVSQASVTGNGYAPGTAVAGFTADGNTNVTFRNTYQTKEGDRVAVRLRKELQGRPLRAGEFEFALYIEGELEDVATNDANGIVRFTREIPATAQPGIYQVEIRESRGTEGGVTYSTQVFSLEVEVFDNNYGKLEVNFLMPGGEILVEDQNGEVDLTDRFVFTNTYEAADTTFTPSATKVLTGRTLRTGEFGFRAQLISVNGAAQDSGTVYTGVSATDGSVIFQSITYTDPGTYIYRITENQGSTSGIRYDQSAYYLKVTVTDDGNGKLVATGAYFSNEACTAAVSQVTFRNTYTPADARVQLEAEKLLTGRRLNDREFSFLVRKDSVNGTLVAVGSNETNGHIQFSTFNISAADMGGATTKTFTYVITEADNNVPGIQVDTTVYTVTVTVTDDGGGNLSATVAYPGGKAIQFQNTYTPEPEQLPLVAYKTLQGKLLAAGEYTFALLDANRQQLQTAENDGNGAITFQSLTFTQAGTYTYYIRELAGSDSRVTYDPSEYQVTVVVTDDGRGNLNLATTYTKAGQQVQVVTFTNVFTPAALETTLTGTKAITDAKGNALVGKQYDLAGFTFRITDAQGSPVGTATSKADGIISFEGFRFTAAGEYRFLITEEATNRAGYAVDPTVWCVHVKVGYNATSGTLYEDSVFIHVAPESHDQAAGYESAQNVTFTNVYTPAPVSVIIQGQKNLEGRQLKEHEFTFTMLDQANGLIAAETRNHADGKIAFHLSYDQAGTYTYKIVESVPKTGLGGVTYSTETHNLTVEVVDDGTGALTAKVGNVQVLGSGTVDLTGSVVFTNHYEAAPTGITLEAHKRLSGMELSNGQFTFELTETDDTFTALAGGISQTATNDMLGHVVFEEIRYTQAGTYYYLLKEHIPTVTNGVTYDAAVYRITVTVTDNGAGSLNAQAVAHSESGENVVQILFHNSYTASGIVELPLTVKKTMTGDRTDPSGFSFGLYQNGDILQTVTSDGDGVVSFQTLVFDTIGVYTYTIREILPVVNGQAVAQADGVTYDKTEYVVAVTVADNGIGGLKLSYTVNEEAAPDGWQAAFTNRYDAPPTTTPDTGDSTNLELLMILCLTSALALIAFPTIKKRKH